jgi:rhodanese-related sulfurtransferase
VQQTIPIHKFNADEISVDKSKTYVMVCQKGLNSYKATEKLKKKYPDLKVLNLTGGISNYK